MSLARRMHNISPFQVMELMGRAKELEQQGHDIVHMEVGEPDFPTPAPVLAAAQEFLASGNVFYTAALGLRHIRALQDLPWRALAALTCVPVLAYVVVPSTLYDHGAAFLTYNATMFAPISGILLVDYFWLRRQQLSLGSALQLVRGLRSTCSSSERPERISTPVSAFIPI